MDAIERLRREISGADAVVVEAGSGLSAASGLTYSGERFEKNFADFIGRYGYRDMYTAGFYPYPTPEEFWAYWSRHIHLNRYAQDAGPAYRRLRNLMGGKDCFVITTNVDHCFQKAGFDALRLFCTQGDYGLWQCARPCHQETYDNEAPVQRMVSEQRDMRIPTELIPRCPRCGGPMANNLRCDDTFVEDEAWHLAAGRYADFLRKHEGARVLFLELGVGWNTPGIIKYPFRRMAARNERAVYACVNLGEADAPRELEGRAILVDGDIGEVLRDLEEA
ncbi:Sir2 silent information regulator family NAD-dependent deacetylase [uncultured Fretibacterium sp.]|uniref:SIR2 family NAD-dependent protein deacylase n=1 Tax=uncultured Fretibacterium sp. TaxID=1678694 RepID=UPI002618A289|nr:Sir2 silent information regulator family NAD-dependent deacetylase [uncultured Fretibacterium sp.]